ncbi:helix-turn-helix domain-containing protein [Halobacillus halophilus]|uniref:helix-turn-helix domain-containing protein n=1 Tax=Halobacillus halophilus TaxID=1570 RepID=UPI00030645C6|nr:helix-turn-helix transcriptional regulator [Halobacillus halophilus]
MSDLAERAGISKSYLSNLERNLNKNPSIKMVDKIASVLGIDLLVLMKNGDINDFPYQPLEKEWMKFINDLKASGVQKDQLNDYKKLIEFINWQNEQEKVPHN